MGSAHKPVRIGIVAPADYQWPGGQTYARMVLRSMVEVGDPAEVEFWQLSWDKESPSREPAVRHASIGAPQLLPGERWLRAWVGLPRLKTRPLPGEVRLRWLLGLPDASDPFGAARRFQMDVVLPVLDLPPFRPRFGVVAWVPDFQHIHLSYLFDEAERTRRDETIRRIAWQADRILLSSENARQDLLARAPYAEDKLCVLPFPSILAFDGPPEEPGETPTKFSLPTKFALVVNQFWRHKNHAVVVDAVAQLRRDGICVPLVMAGLPLDPRDRVNMPLSKVLQAIARHGLHGQVIVLGGMESGDLLDLMRRAAIVIQPSRFEGWSTVIQDSKALGRPVMCSELPVHHEQIPQALGFFPPDRADVLASLLKEHWPRLEAGPSREAEQAALQAERVFAGSYGRRLLEICRGLAPGREHRLSLGP